MIKEVKRKKFGIKKIITIFAIILIVIGLIIFGYFKFYKDSTSFNVDHVFLKTVIKQGEFLITELKITNLENTENFEINIVGLESQITLSENNFKLNPKESKEIEIVFDSTNYAPGVYVGSLNIKNEIEEKIIPVIFEIQTKDILFAITIDVSPKYKEVEKGEETIADINFFNLKDKKTYPVEIEYKIANLKGETISLELKDLTIGSKSSITKSTLIPEDITTGSYIFSIILKSGNTVSTSSYLFSVTPKKRILLFDINNTNLFSLLVVIFLFIMIVLIIYIVYERNKLFNQFKKQQSSELKFYSRGIEKQKEESLRKVKTKIEKEKVFREFRDAKVKVIRQIKSIQTSQLKEFEKLKKKKSKKILEKKLREWKKEIYPRAVENARISGKLKFKLGTLKRAYEEGYISKKSYKKGTSRIKSINEKVK